MLKVTGFTEFVTFTPTLPVAANYASGDYVGASTTPESAGPFVRSSAVRNTGVIQSLTVLDKAAQSLALEVWLFNATFTAPLDSAAWTVTDAQMLTCIGVIPVAASDYVASAANSIATVRNIGLAIKGAAGQTALFIAIVTRGAPTYASGDLVLTFGILQD